MKYISLRSNRASVTEHSYEDAKYGIFLGVVDFVDYERQRITIRDVNSGVPYDFVDFLPSGGSTHSLTDVTMPDVGAKCICSRLSSNRGFEKVVVMQWLLSDTKTGLKALGYMTKDRPKGKNQRKRFLYRKVYPGQKSTTLESGYSSLMNEGWDQQAADLTRDKVDPYARTRTQITGTHITVDESGIRQSGQVLRPGSDSTVDMLPNDLDQQVVRLKSGSRFVDGDENSVPLVESLTRIQEFGLDYPIPAEVLGTKPYYQVLGITENTLAKTSYKEIADDQTYFNDQAVDNPSDDEDLTLPDYTYVDAPTYRRKGYILESSSGTLVGYNPFDVLTYGKVLKPTLFTSKFATDVESGYVPVTKSKDEVETLFAASVFSMRFPYEYNTTRFDVTKEGFVSFEIGSTIPKENISIDSSVYEHPHGAGRSMEGNFLGSVKLQLGKNRDEEESLELNTSGQVILRLGCDDGTLPGSRSAMSTQIRSKNDAILPRSVQFWNQAKLNKLGDAGSLTNKIAAEKVSLRAAFDGGTILRLGARDPKVLRRHLYNGYEDAKGLTEVGLDSTTRKDSRTGNRPTYSAGDSNYSFHDLTKAGASKFSKSPYFYSGSPIKNADSVGLSLDVHAVRDILLRVGANPDSGQSLTLDLGGGFVATIGKDKAGRSITMSLDGGTEITIGPNSEGNALQLEIEGNVNIFCNGNWTQRITGDYYLESANKTEITMLENLIKAMNIRQSAMSQHVSEAPDVVHNQGGYKS